MAPIKPPKVELQQVRLRHDPATLCRCALNVLKPLAVALHTDVEMLIAIAEGQVEAELAGGPPNGPGMFMMSTLEDWNDLLRDIADESDGGFEARERRRAEERMEASTHGKVLTKEARNRATPERPCVLYRLHDTTGRVLYIGVSRNPEARIRTHRHKWGDLIDHVTTEHFDNADAMLAAEALAIRTENPPLNVKGVEGDNARHN